MADNLPDDPPPGIGPAAWSQLKRLQAAGFFNDAEEAAPDALVNKVPLAYADTPVDDFVRLATEALAGRNILFRRGDDVGTVNEDGKWRPMTADRLRSWLPSVAGFYAYRRAETKGGKVENFKTTIPVDVARCVLASDEFFFKLPELVNVNLVRMPVIRESELDERDNEKRKGFRKIELLPLGYDAESKTYTVHQTPDFDEDLDTNDGFTFLKSLLQYFAFSDSERLAVQIAAMLTIFGRGIYSGRPPMFLWNSNLAGSGKSRLSQLCLDPIYGNAGKSGYSFSSGDEVRKELDAAAQVFAPYIWFDDVPKGTIRSTDLNRWLTAKTWQCRVMGTKQLFSGEIRAATFMTGAQLELDSMIARRTLVVDLFPHQKSRNRELPKDAIKLNDQFFDSEEMRGKILASLWSLVRWWDELDRPGLKDIPDLREESPLESFEGWSAIIPPMVGAASFGNCLKTFEAPDAGDTETREFERLAELLIREHAVGRESGTVTMENVVATARKAELFVDHLGALDDVVNDLERSKSWDWKIPTDLDDFDDTEEEKAKALEALKRDQAAGWTDKRLQSSWGKRFRKSAVTGQHFEVDGEVWEFGSRESAKKRVFPMTKVKAPKGVN